MGENVFLLTFWKMTNFKEHELLDVFDAFGKFLLVLMLLLLIYCRCVPSALLLFW